MASPGKALITTHVLDQTTGHPAAGLRVHLHSDDSSIHVAARTDVDGRIGWWTEILHTQYSAATEYGGQPGTQADKENLLDPNYHIAKHIWEQREPQSWRLVFETGAYFKGETFWPVVELVVLIDQGDERGHWHIPLLLGPFGYTTYRGS